MATRVFVIVSGGNVQDCYADKGDAEVEVIDFDNIKDEGDNSVRQAEARVKELSEKLHHIY